MAKAVTPSGATAPAEPEVMRTEREAWEFDSALAREEIARRFKIASLRRKARMISSGWPTSAAR